MVGREIWEDLKAAAMVGTRQLISRGSKMNAKQVFILAVCFSGYGASNAANVEVGGSFIASGNTAERISTGFGGSGKMVPLGPAIENMPSVTVQAVSARKGASISVEHDVIIKDNVARDIEARSGDICAQSICASR